MKSLLPILLITMIPLLSQGAALECEQQLENLAKAEEKLTPNLVTLQEGEMDLVPVDIEDRAFLEKFRNEEDKNLVGDIGDPREIAMQVRDRSSTTPEHFFTAWIIKYMGRQVGYINLGIQYMTVENNIAAKEIINIMAPNYGDVFLRTGYIIRNDYRNQGLATQALKLAIKYAERNLKPRSIFAKVFHDNLASQAVLKKNGFQIVETTDPDFIWFQLTKRGIRNLLSSQKDKPSMTLVPAPETTALAQ